MKCEAERLTWNGLSYQTDVEGPVVWHSQHAQIVTELKLQIDEDEKLIAGFGKKYDALAVAYKEMEKQRNAWINKWCQRTGENPDEVELVKQKGA